MLDNYPILRRFLLTGVALTTLLLAACSTVGKVAHALNAPPQPTPVYIGKVVGNTDGNGTFGSGPTWHAWIVIQSGPKSGPTVGHKLFVAADDDECAFVAAIHNGQIIQVTSWTPGSLKAGDVVILKPKRSPVLSWAGCDS